MYLSRLLLSLGLAYVLVGCSKTIWLNSREANSDGRDIVALTGSSVPEDCAVAVTGSDPKHLDVAIRNPTLQALPIQNQTQLQQMKDGQSYYLTNDILLNAFYHSPQNLKNIFLDGRGFKISGLVPLCGMHTSGHCDYWQEKRALLNELSCSSIKNLLLDNFQIKDVKSAASLMVSATNTLSDNVHVTNSYIQGQYFVGGIVSDIRNSVLHNISVVNTEVINGYQQGDGPRGETSGGRMGNRAL